MKPISSKYAMRRAIATFAAGFIACALGGCSHQTAQPAAASAVPAIGEPEAIAALLSGSAALDCGHDCAAAWTAARPELARRLNGRDWHGLALLVLQTRYQQDLGYYYLGRAAEELGAARAAMHYYQTALALTVGDAPESRCGASPGGCDGAVLPTDEALHIGMTRAALGPRVVARHGPGALPTAAQTVAPPATPPAADDTVWVDPPPIQPGQ